MPVYNEARTVLHAVSRALDVRLPYDLELIVVDDASTDGTTRLLADTARDPRVTVITHNTNRGKGAAVRTALGAARGEVAAVLDADLELDPRDLAPMLRRLLTGGADVVIGIRPLSWRNGQSLIYRLGNRGLTALAGWMFGTRVGDLMTCQKMMHTTHFRSLGLQEEGFAIEAEIVARTLRRGGQIAQVRVSYAPRSVADGKKLRIVDGLRVARTLLRCRLER